MLLLGILGVVLVLALAVRGPGAARAVAASLLLVLVELAGWALVAILVGWVCWIMVQLPSHFR